MSIELQQANVRRRLPRNQRERLIVREAIRFFAEVGFEGQTRLLAQRLGVTQPLLYRYFPDKEALIARVYQEILDGGWDGDWDALLADRSRPLADRLKEFYRRYGQRNFTFERVRLFMFAGLRDRDVPDRYLAMLHQRLFMPLAEEVRAAAGIASDLPPTAAEVEVVTGLHSAIGFVGTRRWAFQVEPEAESSVGAAVSALIDSFITGAVQTAKNAIAAA